MGHLKSTDLPPISVRQDAAARSRNSGWWIWVFIIAGLIVGVWYYRSSRTSTAAVDASAGPGGGKGKSGAGGYAVPVVVATAQRGDLPVYFNGLGTVTAYNTVTVRSRVDGQLISVAFKEGQFVHQGDLLAQIDPRPFQVQLEQAEGQFAKDSAQRKDAEVNFERYKLLFQEGVIARQQLDTQQAAVGQFEGSLRSDQAQINSAKLQLTYSRITSPITGRIGLRLVDVGNIVHATDPNGLLVITQLQPISVIFSLPEDQLPQVLAKLRSGPLLNVEAYDRDDKDLVATGKLATVDNQIDTTTGTYKLKATYTNENNVLFPNQFVNVHLLVDTKHDLTIVPVAAIQRGPQGTYVYTVAQGNTAKIQPVNIAQTSGNGVGISAGLNVGDLVVIDGQDKLQDGSKISPSGGSGNPAGGGRSSGAQAPKETNGPTTQQPTNRPAKEPGRPSR